MREIPLTQGYVALVDDEDYEFLMQWKWHAFKSSSSGNIYAARGGKREKGRGPKHIFMHRVLIDTPDGLDTDHCNGNGLDNRRSNLRSATRAQNMWNRKANINGTSAYKGVFWHKQHRKWIASIQVNRKRFHIGLFTDEVEAAKAYADRAAIEFGEFCRREGVN